MESLPLAQHQVVHPAFIAHLMRSKPLMPLSSDPVQLSRTSSISNRLGLAMAFLPWALQRMSGSLLHAENEKGPHSGTELFMEGDYLSCRNKKQESL